MSKVRLGAAGVVMAALMVTGAGCAVSSGGSGSSAAPSVNQTPIDNSQIDKTKLPDDWPTEAPAPENLAFVDVRKTAGGTIVLGNLEGDDAVAAGNALKSIWEGKGMLISQSSDSGQTFTMTGTTKDGKTQATVTMSKNGDGPLEVILTAQPAA